MQLATIILGSVDFLPNLKDGLLAIWKNRVGYRPEVYDMLSLGMRKPKVGQSRKVSLKVAIPYDSAVQGPDGSPVRTSAASAFVDMVIPTDCTVEKATELRTTLASFIGDAIVADTVDNGAFPY